MFLVLRLLSLSCPGPLLSVSCLVVVPSISTDGSSLFKRQQRRQAAHPANQQLGVERAAAYVVSIPATLIPLCTPLYASPNHPPRSCDISSEWALRKPQLEITENYEIRHFRKRSLRKAFFTMADMQARYIAISGLLMDNSPSSCGSRCSVLT